MKIVKKSMRNFVWKGILGAFLVSACVSCENSQQQVAQRVTADNSSGQCTVIGNEEKARIIEGVSKVDLGMSFNQVRSVMGSPSSTAPIMNKQATRTYGQSWFYVTKLCGKPDRVEVGYDNDYVELLFHQDGSLFGVVSHRVDGVRDRTNLPQPDKQQAARAIDQ
jgi:outer membrane protein assembly factor BamE (lipoprotein component of BamABCDE complex)